MPIAYTLVLHQYNYDVKNEILSANIKHTSILHPHYMHVVATMLLKLKVIALKSVYKVKFEIEHPYAGYTLYGILEMIELVARHRLHHVLDTALVLSILLNKCAVVGHEVIPELHLIM